MNTAIIGSSGGIGAAIVNRLAGGLAEHSGTIFCCSRKGTTIVDARARVIPLAIDITVETSIKEAATIIRDEVGSLDQVIVTTGLLQSDSLRPEKSLRQFDADTFLQVLAVNAVGPVLVAKHLLPLMRRDGPTFFGALSARVGSIGDNRLGGWHSYRASKAALNMLIRNCAIEYRRTHPQLVIAGLHPGTVDTALSAPFQKNVPADKLFSPDHAARALLSVISQLTPEHSGQCFGWDGKRIEP